MGPIINPDDKMPTWPYRRRRNSRFQSISDGTGSLLLGRLSSSISRFG
jgi:hypothetical protein